MAEKLQYHHGDLRRALLDEAVTLIAERGIDGFSLREVAARAGVSHTAPYHHFADKNALIRAVADRGMALLDTRMAAAEEAAGDDARERLLGIGLAYVLFADEEPEYYAAFTSGAATSVPIAPDDPRHAEHGDTWGRLVRAIVAGQQAGVVGPGDPVLLGVYMWSLVHGLAELWRTAPLRLMPQAAGGLGPFARDVISVALSSMEAPR